jgi:hypothetical protein
MTDNPYLLINGPRAFPRDDLSWQTNLAPREAFALHEVNQHDGGACADIARAMRTGGRAPKGGARPYHGTGGRSREPDCRPLHMRNEIGMFALALGIVGGIRDDEAMAVP